MEAKTWKDTVMSEEQLEPIYNKCVEDKHINRFASEVAKAQAEITFNIGRDYGFEVGIEQGKAEGRRGVVDAIRIYDKNYTQNDWGDMKFRNSVLWWLNSKLKNGS